MSLQPRRLAWLRPLLVATWFGLLVLCLRTAEAWWRGELPALSWLEWGQLVLLPTLGWVWWRHLSVFRPDCTACDTVSHPPEKAD